MNPKKNKTILFPPLLIAGVLLVFIPIFTYLTLERIKRQDEFFTQKMFERGMALIRTFEAGTRTGMFTMRWGASRIQTMLQETAIQPDIEYVVITSEKGEVLAHSDPEAVGQALENMPDIPYEEKQPYPGHYRIVNRPEKSSVFEVYKRFVPFGKHGERGKPMRHMRGRMMRMIQENFGENADPKDWSHKYLKPWEENEPEWGEHYIIAGLSMKKHHQKRYGLVKEAVFRSLILFLLACTGILALFALQAWRQTKVSLKHVKALSDNVIQNMPTGLVTIDADSKVTSVNHAAQQIMGKEITEPLAEWTALIEKITPENPVASDEMSFTRGDGQKIRMEIVVSGITEKDNLGYLFLLKDLTQIRELQTQVETNKRLAAIGKLAGGVAHEIRNPLSSIKGLATYFAKQYEDNDTDRETAQIMVNEVERINRSITQLLEFSKPMAIDMKEVSLETLISHSIRLIQPDLEQKKIQTAVEIESRHKKITTDPDRMNQVFLNLYINAIEALEKNGRIDVRVRDSQADNAVDIEIQDNGCGMGADVTEKIFDPYFTTRSTGTGLGLSIVHRIMENLGGSIRVDSKSGQGTTFVITLPVTKSEKEQI